MNSIDPIEQSDSISFARIFIEELDHLIEKLKNDGVVVSNEKNILMLQNGSRVVIEIPDQSIWFKYYHLSEIRRVDISPNLLMIKLEACLRTLTTEDSIFVRYYTSIREASEILLKEPGETPYMTRKRLEGLAEIEGQTLREYCLKRSRIYTSGSYVAYNFFFEDFVAD